MLVASFFEYTYTEIKNTFFLFVITLSWYTM
jgi:hypothetical protein